MWPDNEAKSRWLKTKSQFAVLLSLPLFIATVLIPPGRISWRVVWIPSYLNTYVGKSKWNRFSSCRANPYLQKGLFFLWYLILSFGKVNNETLLQIWLSPKSFLNDRRSILLLNPLNNSSHFSYALSRISEKEQKGILAIIKEMHDKASSRVPLSSLAPSHPYIPCSPSLQSGLQVRNSQRPGIQEGFCISVSQARLESVSSIWKFWLFV